MASAFSRKRTPAQRPPGRLQRATLAIIAEHTADTYELEAIRQHAEAMEHSARAAMREPSDREALDERLKLVIAAFESPELDLIAATRRIYVTG